MLYLVVAIVAAGVASVIIAVVAALTPTSKVSQEAL